MKKSLNLSLIIMISAVALLSSCKKTERSATTGWGYNSKKWGGFEKKKYDGQITGPNLVLIEGGTFDMGLTEQDVTFEWNNVPRRVTVSSFYMDETEVANIDYLEYLFWLKVHYPSYPEVYQKALPDTLVWRAELSYNEPFVENYLRHPSYSDYPVVGVSWQQATEYCKWRTDRVNEMLLVEKGIINQTPDQKDAETFNTEAYLAGKYTPASRKSLKDLNTGTARQVQYEDGILLPAYRLPTEAEWEYAALGLQGNMASSKDERITDKRIYAWNGSTVRWQRHDKNQGDMLANFKRGAGDYMGMAGNLNDHAARPAPVRTFLPNDFGLYNMAGNVNEWVQDIYRPMTSLTLRDAEGHDLDPFRGNLFLKKKTEKDEKGNEKLVEKDSLGHIVYVPQRDDEVANRENYKRTKLYDYMDGDSLSSLSKTEAMYQTGKSTLISDKSRVYKGGSWADRAFWLSPGSRRFKDEDKSDSKIGFRCAMTRNGAPSGNNDNGGNTFKQAKRKDTKRKYK